MLIFRSNHELLRSAQHLLAQLLGLRSSASWPCILPAVREACIGVIALARWIRLWGEGTRPPNSELGGAPMLGRLGRRCVEARAVALATVDYCKAVYEQD